LEPGEPPLRVTIINRLEEVVKGDARWQEAARRRGVNDFSRVSILPQLSEGIKLPVRGGDRFIPAFCFFWDDASSAPIMTGLTIEVNLTKGTLTQFEDRGPDAVTAAKKPKINPATEARARLRRLETIQSEGRSFQLQGSELRWQNWRLHYGVH